MDGKIISFLHLNMKIYNITFIVENSVENDFLDWLKNEHIQKLQETNCFGKARLTKICAQQDPNSKNYSLQLEEKDNLLATYLKDFAPKLKHEIMIKFANRVLFFETELEHLHDF
ncbi:hypothetical protein Ornrh_1814 [Ornithobacterium rhinotracheale DSM 15997]|uniref:DUF4286 family protein n=2 Tax=Ornithobacterium rhinotracheale TaxID=28251 RepID=I4A1Y0_ORNRL|nr:hypothetical protein Ornrh_1814 [Ornithobacterium rhinotracheale DSM 15997]